MYLMNPQLHGSDDDAVRGKGREIDALRSTQACEQDGTWSPSYILFTVHPLPRANMGNDFLRC